MNCLEIVLTIVTPKRHSRHLSFDFPVPTLIDARALNGLLESAERDLGHGPIANFGDVRNQAISGQMHRNPLVRLPHQIHERGRILVLVKDGVTHVTTIQDELGTTPFDARVERAMCLS